MARATIVNRISSADISSSLFPVLFLSRTFINPEALSPMRRDNLLASVELPFSFLFYSSGHTFPRLVIIAAAVVARGRVRAYSPFSLSLCFFHVNCDFILQRRIKSLLPLPAAPGGTFIPRLFFDRKIRNAVGREKTGEKVGYFKQRRRRRRQ